MYSANNPNEEILRLRAENEKLRAALKPFAWHVTTEVLFEDLPDEHVIERCGIKLGDLRAARAALKEMGDE